MKCLVLNPQYGFLGKDEYYHSFHMETVRLWNLDEIIKSKYKDLVIIIMTDEEIEVLPFIIFEGRL